MTEEWKPIPGYEGYYEVSSLGCVRSLARVVPSTARGLRRTVPPRILKHNINRYGYPMVTLCFGTKKLVTVHKLVALAFHGPCPEGYECAHLDGNRENPRADNLKWVTQAENESHKILHGTKSPHRKPPIVIGPPRHSHCKRGHPMEGHNIKMRPKGRHCRICWNESQSRWRAKRRKERGAVL